MSEERGRMINCTRVRDRFSDLWEKELDLSEEREIKEHLASCPECREDFARFDKTLSWLHSVDQVEVPEDFLSGIDEKMKTRGRYSPPSDKVRPEWLSALSRMRIPMQAVAMVAIVFLALYLTKRAPIEESPPKDAGKEKLLLSATEPLKKIDEGLSPRAIVPPPAEGRSRAMQPSSGMERSDLRAVQEDLKEEKGPETPSQEPGPVEAAKPKESEGPGLPHLMEKKAGKEEMPHARASLEASPPEKIILRVPDRKRAFSQIGELARELGGEVLSAEGNTLFVSLPSDSFSGFEKGLTELSLSPGAGEADALKDKPAGFSAASEAKKKGVRETTDTGAARTHSEKKGRINVRVFLVLE